MRRLFSTTVALAAAMLAQPIPFPNVTDGIERDKRIAEARFLVERYGGLIDGRMSLVELHRKGRQRRRARQTHPGKRGRA